MYLSANNWYVHIAFMLQFYVTLDSDLMLRQHAATHRCKLSQGLLKYISSGFLLTNVKTQSWTVVTGSAAFSVQHKSQVRKV